MLDMHDDQEMKDRLLEDLIGKMEDIIAGRMEPKKAVSVEVAAPDKAHLADGLDKAKDVIEHAPIPGMEAAGAEEPEDKRSDAERLAELMGDEEDDEDDEDELKR